MRPLFSTSAVAHKKPSLLLTPLLAFGLCMLLSFGAAFFAFQSAQTENRSRFDRTLITFSDLLSNRMTIYTNALIYCRNLFAVKESLTAEDFRAFVSEMHLQENYPGIHTLGYVARVDRKGAERIIAETGVSLEDVILDESRTEFDIVRFLEVINTTPSRVLGVDLGASTERKEAMNRARDLGAPVATPRVVPLNTSETKPAYAFLVFVPHYRRGAPLNTIDERRRAIKGFVYGGFRAENLFGRITESLRLRSSDFSIRIYDGPDFDEKNLLFSDEPQTATPPSFKNDFHFKFAEHAWAIRVQAPKDFSIPALAWAPYLILAVGTILSAIVALAIRRSQKISARLQEDILVRKNTEKLLNEARREADEANRAKSVFLANISHEIRTPLGVMIGFAELARTEQSEKDREAQLQTVLRNGKELTRIVGDVLDVSKIEAKSLVVEPESFDLKSMFDEVVEAWKPQVLSKGLRFDCAISPRLPKKIVADPTRLKQILTNLLSNATKFTARGFVALSVNPDTMLSGAPALLFAVQDSGIGIPSGHRLKLFRPFSQGDESMTRKFGGSGLGLALSQEIARFMGGKLSLVNNDGQEGSHFTLRIPLEESFEEEELNPAETPKQSLKGKRILVVDDIEDNRHLIALILKDSLAAIDLAHDGDEALTCLSRQHYDLVLMDLQMPGKDGYSAFAEIRAKGITVPVAALTANALPEERKRAISLGFNAYLTKPINDVSLLKTCDELTKIS